MTLVFVQCLCLPRSCSVHCTTKNLHSIGLIKIAKGAIELEWLFVQDLNCSGSTHSLFELNHLAAILFKLGRLWESPLSFIVSACTYAGQYSSICLGGDLQQLQIKHLRALWYIVPGSDRSVLFAKNVISIIYYYNAYLHLERPLTYLATCCWSEVGNCSPDCHSRVAELIRWPDVNFNRHCPNRLLENRER